VVVVLVVVVVVFLAGRPAISFHNLAIATKRAARAWRGSCAKYTYNKYAFADESANKSKFNFPGGEPN
jgi:hypothetical protein